MGDMVEDNSSMSRRSNLPARIVQDRPDQQERQLPFETIAADGRHKIPLQEQQIIRTIKNMPKTKGETKTQYDDGAKNKTEKEKKER